ncbi:MAG TPA: DUF1634 domain-containing protein [Polyangiaceae bacterium]|jgi:uncharacterized membrane protein|nr:DUF1634 domain-containing protein [Polyangiaceae bacterium]
MSPLRAFERRVAVALEWGTWAACAAILTGLVWPAGHLLVTAGIALFIALPVLRVAGMVVEFVRIRDLRMGAVAALVLAILALAIVLNLQTNRGGG